MTVILLLHPKISCMTIPLVMLVKNCRTIPPCGNFSNHISRPFRNHSSHWFRLSNVMQALRFFSLHELNYRDGRPQVSNDYSPCGNFSNHISWTFWNHSSHWFKLNDIYNGMILSPSNRGHISISIQKRMN
jgi:hypothetical protein